MILRDGELELHAEHVLVEAHGLPGVLAAIGDVVDPVQGGRGWDGGGDHAGALPQTSFS